MQNQKYTIKRFFNFICSELSGIYEYRECKSIALTFMEAMLNIKRDKIPLHFNDPIQDDKIILLNSGLKELIKGRPIQQVIGKTEFYGLEFMINENVLIPRPETEGLVDRIIKENTKQNPSILDIGTGSGCIAISLAKNIPCASVYASDNSKKALEIASVNCIHNEVKVQFIQNNILESPLPFKKYDIIVSNPPYVRKSEKNKLHKNVVAFEPEDALFVPDADPLVFYQKIAERGQYMLFEGGLLYFEINEFLGKEIMELLNVMDYSNILIRKDLHNKDRFIRAEYAV
ncbi:peptide chain release factor N(5)-glutamine methyltransferase [Bacteroidota bacterium]